MSDIEREYSFKVERSERVSPTKFRLRTTDGQDLTIVFPPKGRRALRAYMRRHDAWRSDLTWPRALRAGMYRMYERPRPRISKRQWVKIDAAVLGVDWGAMPDFSAINAVAVDDIHGTFSGTFD